MRQSLNGMNEAINITSSDSSLNISENNTVNPKTIDLTLNGTIPTVNDKTIGLVQEPASTYLVIMLRQIWLRIAVSAFRLMPTYPT